ncbi:hypothetical protein [Streptomyces sp. NPDC002685]|uniref:hypothetical protein n=1 Tax=Streptomyces sp. NPDC002685 TaxID=3154540 RepID=UPI00331FEEFB
MWAQAHPLPTSIAGVLLVAIVVGLARAGRKAASRPPAAVVVASLAAMACTAYSGDTSWGFAEHRLHMTSTAERGAMFAAAELALFSCALMARQNLNTQGAPGTPGVLVWFITSVQVIPAYSESGFVGGTVRAVVGPVMAALLWHLAMGIELRHAKPGTDSSSLPALLARELRERLLSRLGLAVRDRSAEQISRDRWTVKAVGLAAKLADTPPEGRGRARVARRLSVAVGRAQAGASEEQRTKLLDLLAARRHAASLATIDLVSPWQNAIEATAERVTEARPELPPAPRPAVVPAGVSLLPLVSRQAPERTFRFDSWRQRWVPVDEPKVTSERSEDDRPDGTEPRAEVVIPTYDSRVPDWSVKEPYWKGDPVLDPAPAVPAERAREVVTQVITLTPSELLKRALKLNRELVSSGQRPVTIDRLRQEFNLSRRDATELRRQVVTTEGR